MIKNRQRPPIEGALYGLTAAVLFGVSLPLAKTLLADIQPFILAGLFYFGSGLGLALWGRLSRMRRNDAPQARLTRSDWKWLAPAILSGGIIAEVLLMWGLTQTPASEASLLLNLEGAFGALIAWIVFKEHANLRVVLGMVLLTAGAMVLSVGPNMQMHFSLPSLVIVVSCVCWGIDNNLTRKISGADPVQITAIKGLVAGLVNILLGLVAGGHIPSLALSLTSMAIGLLSYGVSLVLFIYGLRHVGAARTSAYFSAAPFIGAGASVLFLHDPVTIMLAVSAILMAAGLWLHLTEDHEHTHQHEPVLHEHPHVHDEHHLHEHTGTEPAGQPHTHKHLHEPLVHSHPHMPDIHHEHTHPEAD